MRPPVTVTNIGPDKKVYQDKWFVRVGSQNGKPRWRAFSEVEWARGGLVWLRDQLKRGQ